jgi:hypothetical protein
VTKAGFPVCSTWSWKRWLQTRSSPPRPRSIAEFLKSYVPTRSRARNAGAWPTHSGSIHFQTGAIARDFGRTFRPRYMDRLQPFIELLAKTSRRAYSIDPIWLARPRGPNSGMISFPFARKQRYESHMNKSSTAGAAASTLTASRSAGIGCAVISR